MSSEANNLKPFIEAKDRADELADLSKEKSTVISTKVKDLIEMSIKKVREPQNGKRKDGKDGSKDGKDDKSKDGDKIKEGKDGKDGDGTGKESSDKGKEGKEGSDGPGPGGPDKRTKDGEGPGRSQEIIIGKDPAKDPDRLDFESIKRINDLRKAKRDRLLGATDKPIM